MLQPDTKLIFKKSSKAFKVLPKSLNLAKYGHAVQGFAFFPFKMHYYLISIWPPQNGPTLGNFVQKFLAISISCK